MPGLDRSGPMGAGVMTGGRRGFCNPANTEYREGYSANYGRGLGLGRRFQGSRRAGRGYCFGRGVPFRSNRLMTLSASKISKVKSIC